MSEKKTVAIYLISLFDLCLKKIYHGMLLLSDFFSKLPTPTYPLKNNKTPQKYRKSTDLAEISRFSKEKIGKNFVFVVFRGPKVSKQNQTGVQAFFRPDVLTQGGGPCLKNNGAHLFNFLI